MSSKFDIDLSGLDTQMQLMVLEHLREYAAQEAIAAEAEQILIAQENERQALRAIDGIGPQVLSMSPLAFIHFKAVEQLDFSNPKDVRWLGSRYPEMKVKSGATRLQVAGAAVPGAGRIQPAPGVGKKRFTKSYG